MLTGNKILHENGFRVKLAVMFIAFLAFSTINLSAQVIVNKGAYVTVAGGFVFSNDLDNDGLGSLTNNGTLDLAGFFYNRTGSTAGGNGTFILKRDWLDYGTFNQGTSSVILNGSVNQLIEHGSFGENFYNLLINNPGIVTHTAATPPGSLRIWNDFELQAGTFNIHNSTINMIIGGNAALAGIFNYGNVTQSVSVTGNLGGTGTINMSPGDLPHTLNLAGATNSIGTFTTSANVFNESTVNYNGSRPTQTVFPALNYHNLTISGTGSKILQGNSRVMRDLTISGGTFDLGTTAVSFDVDRNTTLLGGFSFNGTTTKIVRLTGNLLGTGTLNMSGENKAHELYLNGQINDIGTYSSGLQSTVFYIRNDFQTVFASNDYRNLSITGTGVKSLVRDVTAKGTLTMAAGDIDAAMFVMEVSNPALNAIVRTAGKVMGRLKRAVAITGGDYLYPVGRSLYNPFNIRFQHLVNGSLTVQFREEDIGTDGLPLDDQGNEIYDTYDTGFWTLTASSGSLSNNYTIRADFEGFTGIDASASIIKRTNNGNLELDGVHGTVTADEISRNNLVNGISAGTTDIGIGRGRPRINDQPDNIDICETFNAFFEIDAGGIGNRGSLTYQWEVSTNGGMTYNPLVNGGVYSGVLTDRLEITGAPFTMNGYRYRCIVTDGQGHSNISMSALLTVNLIPIATATTPPPECPGVAFQTIMLGTSNGVTGTTFTWSRTNPAGIVTTMPLTGSAPGDVINGTFNNTTDDPITVVFTIYPKGPGTTFCIGVPITTSVTVNPTPRVFGLPANSTQCDNTATDIRLTSPSHFTSGVVDFRYTVTTSGNVTGFTSPVNGLPDEHHITDVLVNNTNTYQTVTYRVVPESPVGCVDGMAIDINVTVNPTPRAIPVNNVPEICFGGTTQIVLTTPTVMTDGFVVFDYTVASTGGGVVTGNMAPGDDINPGQTISRSYQNSSHAVQSVFYTITPVNNTICPAGPPVISEVKVHAIPVWDITQTRPLTCDGGAGLGALRAELSTGASPFHIIWNGPDNYHREDVAEIDDLFAGVYSVVVYDNLGCQGKSNEPLVPQYADPYIYPYLKYPGYPGHVTCEGNSDGKIRVGVWSGITGPYNYQVLKNGSTVIETGVFNNLVYEGGYSDISGLSAGSYTIVITDVNSCVRSESVKLVPPPAMAVTFGKTTYSGGFNVSCRGYNDGSAWVTNVSGGRPGYTYLWSTTDGSIPGPKNTNRIDNITAGTYTLEVTDMSGCKAYFNVVMNQPEGMDLVSSILSQSNDNSFNISCNGGSDGSIDMTIQGGSGSYLYNWTGPAGFTSTVEDPSGLKAGNYSCTVTDLNGCVLTPVPSFTLTEPAPLMISTVTSVSADGAYQINCHGGTGSISAVVSGGSSSGYTYTWSTANGSGIVQGMQNQNSLKAGTYHLKVEDYNSCITETDITLTEPPALVLNLIPRHVTCEVPGFSNGSVDLSVAGGAGVMSYAWSNGAATQDISGLPRGTYQVTVTYNGMCTGTGSVEIKNPPSITYTSAFSNYNSFEVSCYGRSDGEIHITPTNGTAPYSYSWTGPGGFISTSPDLTGLRAGTYNLTITDANLCTASEIIEMRQPGELEVRFTVSESRDGGFNISCAGDNTGTINVTPVNSVNNVNYLWSDGFMGRARANLKAGDYTVVITDDNNCQAIGSTTLTQPDSLKMSYEIKQPFCPDMPDGEIRLTVTGGVPGGIYTYRWSDNSNGNRLSEIPMGKYVFSVEDINRCSVKDSIMLMPVNESCLIIPNMISPNGDLINDYWNIGMKELYPKMEVKIINRWGNTIWKSERGYPVPWDGRSNGSLLPIDSYHYIIDLHNGTKPIVGNVTLVK